jgi:hypothetical protein
LQSALDAIIAMITGGGDYLGDLTDSEISITATGATLTISRQHVISGTSSDYTVTLPAASGNSGKFIGIRILNTATKLFTIDGNSSETIDGALTRIMWAGESAVLYCDGSNWFKISGKTIPVICNISQTAGDQSVSSATSTLVTVNNVIDDSVGMADLSNRKIIIRRPGIYTISGAVGWNGISAASARCLTQLTINDAFFANSEVPGVIGGAPTAFATRSKSAMAVSDYIRLVAYQNSGLSQSTDGVNGVTFVGCVEVPSW